MYRRFRAPRRHGEVLADPPLEEAGCLLRANRLSRARYDCDIQGQPLEELVSAARRHLRAAALQYTAAYRDVAPPPDAGAPFILAGHQPQLFHAGVWFKNFALSSAGRHLGAVAVNLLIDNDILQNPSIRVPALSPSGPVVTTIAFDQVAEAIPYEERAVVDGDLFTSFGRRVAETIEPFQSQPLIRRLWPMVVQAAEQRSNVGQAIAEGRHRIEAAWGLQTLEVPLSAICRSRPFLGFTAHILAHLPRFHEIHNTALSEYRAANRVRSRSHPVPDLAADGAWLEAPFWIWSSDRPHRRRLFVRPAGEQLVLTDREGFETRIALSEDRDACRAVDQLSDEAERGIKVRPRALLTTMYARLVLSDLFVHGIGGAKYDELTDLIIQRFFGLCPPRFMTLSATALLFEDATPRLRAELHEKRRRLRELSFHPERHVAPSPEVEQLVAEKRHWIRVSPPRGQRLERHRAIERINRALEEYLVADRRRLARECRRLEAELRCQTQLASREFSFCLFSEDALRALLLDLARLAP